MQMLAYPVEYVPAGQREQAVFFVPLENVPAGHMVQALDDVDPVFATKYPGWHLEQTAAPAGEYVPVAQVMQVAMAVAPRTAEKVPAAQSEHTAVPVASAYDPAGHGMHCVEPATE